MSKEEFTISSEIYTEFNYATSLKPLLRSNNIVSVFPFENSPYQFQTDNDGDIIVERKISNKVEIEHRGSTILDLVGLQVWRGALLLADWILYNGDRFPKDITILELGSGTGLTTVIAAKYAPVISTDINKGDILELLKVNIERNKELVNFSVNITEVDFSKKLLPDMIQRMLPQIKFVIAADVIYDNQLTEDFVYIIKLILNDNPSCEVYVALEKRYVFTVADCDSVAPCYQFFIDCIKNVNLLIDHIPLDFPQYFKYDRVKELELCKICFK